MWVKNPTVQKVWTRALTTVNNGGIVSSFFNFFMGRCTFAAIVFSIIGVYGWLHGKDLTSYAIFVGAIQSLLVLHSWKSDLNDQRSARLEWEKLKTRDASELRENSICPSRDS